MKRILLAIALASVFQACDNKSSEPKTSESKELTEPELHTELYGIYVGDFATPDDFEADYESPVKISMNISRITAKGASGRSVVKGNDRPMAGQLTTSANGYKFLMDEPGDHKHDGRFEFTITGDTIVGTWEAYDKKAVKIYRKTYTLVKKPFQYNPNLMLPDEFDFVDYENGKTKNELYHNEDGTVDTMIFDIFRAASDAVTKLNASTQVLTEAQLKNLKKLDLEIIRNTIFARHGYSFKKKGVRQFFDHVEWYTPISNNVDDKLTEIEKENIKLLQRLEQHAKDNYDNFGR